MTLNDLKLKTPAKIIKISDSATQDVIQRFYELGLIPMQNIEIIHKAPMGGDPIAVRVSNNLVGIGIQEAKQIQIETL